MRKNPVPLVEVCVETASDARTAQDAGADRIELCSDLLEGGITPSAGLVRATRKILRIPLMVMIRPRGGDFVYDEFELEAMRGDVEVARECGADGVVLGLLDRNGSVDGERTRELVERARPLAVTFHRAFDATPEAGRSIEILIGLGVDRILTSGGAESAEAGLETLRDLVQKAGTRITILAGGGVRSHNVTRILEETGVREVHTSGCTTGTGERRRLDADEVRRIVGRTRGSG